MFKNAGHALEWAYNMAAKPILKTSAINDMRQGRAICTDNMLLINLNNQDAHGQAAQIISMVERLGDPAGREYLAAKFGARTDRNQIRILVYRGCASLGLGLEKRETVYRIMKAYFHFRGEVSLRMIQRELGCRHLAATMAKTCLYDMLDIIHHASLAEISGVFEQKGLIDSAYYAYG